jgi:hypothetical protein
MKVSTRTNSIFLVFLFLVSLLISCEDSDNNDNDNDSIFISNYQDYRLLKLKGNVKSMLSYTYNNNDSLIKYEHFFFNLKGQTIEKRFKAFEISVSHQYQYNSKGEQLAFKRIEDGKVVTDDKRVDSLDSKKRLARRRTYDLNNQLTDDIEYYYSPKGDLIISNDIYNGLTIDSSFYDLKGNLIKERYISFNTDSIQDRDITTYYKSMNNKVSEIICFKKNESYSKEILTYDSLGNLVNSITYLSEMDPNYYERSQIIYNSEGLKTDSIYQFCSSSGKDNESTKECNMHILKYNFQEKIQSLIIKRKGKTLSKTTFYYNKKGLLLRKKISYSEGFKSTYFDKMGYNILSKYWDKDKTFLYEDQAIIKYDSKNNIIEAKLLIKGKLDRVLKRDYEYY